MPNPKTKRLKSRPVSLQLSAVSRFTVGRDGVINDGPEHFVVSQNDVVVWAVTNASGQPITVTVGQFLRKKHIGADEGDPQDPVTPFQWLVPPSIDLEIGASGFLGGVIQYVRRDMVDGVSYTIGVRSRATQAPFDPIDYDPDGDIKP